MAGLNAKESILTNPLMKISVATWRKAEELFAEFLELPDNERNRRLESLLTEDPEIHTLLNDLLREESNPHPLLAQSAPQLMDIWLEDETLCGQQIGVYRLAEHLGAGAMGSVFRAERADGQFDQTVALKLIRPGTYNEASLALFREERQILAGLQHPNIARLYDGGLHGLDRPFFTMEYVSGLPVTEYCRHHRLGLYERLELFIQICQALQYAHGRLIAHLDLKPGNILVEAGGLVKLLDFGIARAGTESEHSYGILTQNRFTLAYASPEQLNDEAPGVWSDIYTLGTLLFELLSGLHPQEEFLHDRLLLRQAIAGKEEPPALEDLSDPLPSGIPVVHLRGDLNAICRQAMQKRPAKRYSSVEGLIRDIRAFIDHFPVRARSGSKMYRLRKFARRNRNIFTALASALIFLIITSVYYTVQLARERDHARLEAAKASEVSRLLREVFSSADPLVNSGEEVTALELLDAGIAGMQGNLRHQPDLQASMFQEIGAIYLGLGHYARADSIARRAYTIFDSIYQSPHPDIARSLRTIAQVEITMGRLESASATIHNSLDIYRLLKMTGTMDYAQALLEKGNLYYERNEFAKADSIYGIVFNRYTQEYRTDHQEMANLLHLIGTTRRKLGDYAVAGDYLQQSLAMKQRLYGEPHAEIAYTLNHLASLRQDQGRPAEALPFAREAFEQRRKIFGEQHIETLASQSNIARIHVRLGQLNQAASVYEEVLPKMRSIFQDDHHYVPAITNSLAGVYLKIGDYAEAERLCREALDYNDRLLAADDPKRAFALLNLGRALLAQGKAVEARPSLEAALQLREESLPQGHVLRGECHQALGECLMALGDYPASISALEASYKTLSAVPERYADDINAILHALVRAYRNSSNFEKTAYYEALLAGL